MASYHRFTARIENLQVMLPITATDPATMRQIFRLRVVAWQADGGLPSVAPRSDYWEDSHDSHALHWVIRENEEVVAAARLCVHRAVADLPEASYFEGLALPSETPVASLNRLVVAPRARRRGFSRQLDQARIDFAYQAGARCIVASTHKPHRVEAFQARGFRLIGPAAIQAVAGATTVVLALAIQR